MITADSISFLGCRVFAFCQEPIRVIASHFRQIRIYVAFCILAVLAMFASGRAQSRDSTDATLFHGCVQDPSGKRLANAWVSLLTGAWGQPFVQLQGTRTDSEGRYRFEGLHAGVYSLRAQMDGYDEASFDRVNLAQNETSMVNFTLWPAKTHKELGAPPPTPASEPNAPAPAFYDEPQFTVAGVTEASNSGGHASDTVLRTTEALARATASLGNTASDSTSTTPSKPPSKGSNTESEEPPAAESSLRDAVARNPSDAALHHQLGNVEEKLGNPLEAVREYQRAAELEPSEPYLFDWGTELLTHRALDPATEVFARGNRLFPKSTRMLVALGVADYARGSYDEAAQYLGSASDLDPANPTPYLFLGKMQSGATAPLAGTVQRLGRFVELQPDNPLANYYYAVGLYAVGLWKESENRSATQSLDSADAERDDRNRQPPNADVQFARVESLLQKAVKLDPKLGVAYLQLGILYSQRGDFSRAIPAYERAIAVISEETTPHPANPQLASSQVPHPEAVYSKAVHLETNEALAESHYRLAQAYLRTGDKARAQEQLQLHAQLSKKAREDTDRQHHEIQEFVISLRSNDSASH
jgi:tetratricopeptide (TPR) repeat protein